MSPPLWKVLSKNSKTGKTNEEVKRFVFSTRVLTQSIVAFLFGQEYEEPWINLQKLAHSFRGTFVKM